MYFESVGVTCWYITMFFQFVNCETAESFLYPKIHIYEMSGGVDHTLTTGTSEWHFPLASHWVIKNQTSKVTERRLVYAI